MTKIMFDLYQMNLSASQSSEAAELRQRLLKEQEMLASSQAKHSQQLTLQLQREEKELEQKIMIRRSLLDQKVCPSSCQPVSFSSLCP